MKCSSHRITRWCTSAVFSIILIAGYSSPGYASDLPTFGFIKATKQAHGADIVCNGQCGFVLSENRTDVDEVTYDATFEGSGQLMLGYAIGQQIFPLYTIALQPRMTGQHILPPPGVRLPPLPDDTKVLAIIVGRVAGNINITPISRGLGKNISMCRDDFRSMDTFKPYTINLLFGPKVRGRSANGLFYWLLAIGIIGILLWGYRPSQRHRQKCIFIGVLGILLCLWLAYDVRMSHEMTMYYRTNYNRYVTKQPFRDRDDFYYVMDNVRETLSTPSASAQNVAFITDQQWPYEGSATYFLYPYVTTHSLTGTYDTLIGYKTLTTITASGVSLKGKDIGTGALQLLGQYGFIFYPRK